MLVALVKNHAAVLCQLNCHLMMVLFLAEAAVLYFSPLLCVVSLAASAGVGIFGSLPVQIPFLTSTTATAMSAVFLTGPWVLSAAKSWHNQNQKIEA